MAGTHEGLTEYQAFVRAVCSSPADDTPRLVFADWLEEHDGVSPCTACNGNGYAGGKRVGGFPAWAACKSCNGYGAVPNRSRERAEFIRVQCRIGRLDDPYHDPDGEDEDGSDCSSCGELEGLRERESELFTDANALEWCRSLGRGYVEATAGRTTTGLVYGAHPDDRKDFGVTFSRGFVSGLTLSAADFLTHAAALFAGHPIEKVTLSDAVVHPSGGNDTYYVGGLGRFPREYWTELENLPSRTAALTALSRVCVEWGRALVGLPPLG